MLLYNCRIFRRDYKKKLELFFNPLFSCYGQTKLIISSDAAPFNNRDKSKKTFFFSNKSFTVIFFLLREPFLVHVCVGLHLYECVINFYMDKIKL